MDNFNVQPVMDGYSAETNMEIDQFFGPNRNDIFRNDKKSNYDTQELYDIVDEIDVDVSEVEDTLDHYDEEFCGKDGEKCFTCKRPDLPEYAEFEQCGNPLDTDNNIPLNEICKLKCKDGYEEQPDSKVTGVCSHQSPEPRNPLSYLNELFLGQYEATFQPSPSIGCNKTCKPLTNEKLKEKRGLTWARVEPNCEVTGYSSPPEGGPTQCDVTCITKGSPTKYQCSRSGDWEPVDTNGKLRAPIQCENPCSLPSRIKTKYEQSVDFTNVRDSYGNYSGGENTIQCNRGYYPYNGDPFDKDYTLDCTDYDINTGGPQNFYWNYPPKGLSGLPDNIINSVYNGENFYLCNSPCPHSFDMINPYSSPPHRSSPKKLTFECSSPANEIPEKICYFEIGSPNNQEYYFRYGKENYTQKDLKCEGNSGSPNANWSSPGKEEMRNSVRKICETDNVKLENISKKINNLGEDYLPSEILNNTLVYVGCSPSNFSPSPHNKQTCYFTLSSPYPEDYYFHYQGKAHTRLPLVCDSSPGRSNEWRFDGGDLSIYKYCSPSSPPDTIHKIGTETQGPHDPQENPPEGKFFKDSKFNYNCKDGGKNEDNLEGYYLKNRSAVSGQPGSWSDPPPHVTFTCLADGRFNKDFDSFNCKPYCKSAKKDNWWSRATDINVNSCGTYLFEGETCDLECNESKDAYRPVRKGSEISITQKCEPRGFKDLPSPLKPLDPVRGSQDNWGESGVGAKICEYEKDKRFKDFTLTYFISLGVFTFIGCVHWLLKYLASVISRTTFKSQIKGQDWLLLVYLVVAWGSGLLAVFHFDPPKLKRRDIDKDKEDKDKNLTDIINPRNETPYGDRLMIEWCTYILIIPIISALVIVALGGIVIVIAKSDRARTAATAVVDASGRAGAAGVGAVGRAGAAAGRAGRAGAAAAGDGRAWVSNVSRSVGQSFGVVGRSIAALETKTKLFIVGFVVVVSLITTFIIYELTKSPDPQPEPPDPTPPSPPQPHHEGEIYIVEEGFPKQNLEVDNNGKLCIQILNDTEDKDIITVWLDDVPFCDKWIQEDDEGNSIDRSQIERGIVEKDKLYEENCGVKEGGNVWETYVTKMETIHGEGSDKVVRFVIINEDGSIYWDSNKRKDIGYSDKFKGQEDLEIIPDPTKINRYFKLKPKQVLRIIPPHKYQNLWHYEHCGNHENDPDGGMGGNECQNMGYCPYMCALQKDPEPGLGGERGFSYGEHDSKAGGIAKNCPGGGIYITDNIDVTKYKNITTDSVSRVEYNINNGEIYFNFSAVDGSNMNYEAHYDLRDRMGNLQGDKGNPPLCEGMGSILCNTKHLEETGNFEGLEPDNSYNYLDYDNQFRNLSPFVRSIPSIKFFNSDTEGNLYPGIISEGHKCVSPINWNEGSDWVKAIKAIKIFNDNLNKDTPNDQLYKWDGSRDWSNWNREFNHEGLKTEQREITDKNCAEAPSKNAFNKAIYHIWWGLRKNKCASDYTKIIRNSNNGKIGCSQYTWAYGEMGYDSQGTYGGTSGQLESYLSEQDPVLYFSPDGNPQYGPLCDSPDTENRAGCSGKQKNDIPKDNNLESANKPLLHCRLPNNFERDIKYQDLKNNPVNINIKIKYLTRGKYDINQNPRRKRVCDTKGVGCDDLTKKCINPRGGDQHRPTCTDDHMENCFKNMFAHDDKGIPKDFTWCGPI